MPADLRAPDPTLNALADDDGFSVVLLTGASDPSVAHLHPIAACGADGTVTLARDARWFAVPCRTCFPEASEPGRADRRAVEPWDRLDPDDGALYVRTISLAWQVPDREVSDAS